MPVQAIPDGYHAITPHLICDGAQAALDFYARALGAEPVMVMPGPGGKVMHAEMKIGDSRFMLSDEFPEMGARAPLAYGGTPVSFYLYVADCDAAFQRAVDAGAKVKRPVETQFYGDRHGGIEDPFGHVWYLATHVEDVSPDEIERRQAGMGQHG